MRTSQALLTRKSTPSWERLVFTLILFLAPKKLPLGFLTKTQSSQNTHSLCFRILESTRPLSAGPKLADFPAVFFIFGTLIFVMKLTNTNAKSRKSESVE